MLQKLNSKRGGFTLVEIMIVVAIIALLAAIAVPNFLRARKRSQATRTLEDLRMIDAAVDQYAIEFNKSGTARVGWTDVKLYLKTGTKLYTAVPNDMFGKAYSISTIDVLPILNQATFYSLSDVAPMDFWSPYNVGLLP